MGWATASAVLENRQQLGILMDGGLPQHRAASVAKGMPRVRRHDDHVASRGVHVLALDLVTPLAVVEDEDFGVRMPMATWAAAGNNLRVHDRSDEAVLKSGQLPELTTSGRHGPLDELKFGVGYMAGLHRCRGPRRLGSNAIRPHDGYLLALGCWATRNRVACRTMHEAAGILTHRSDRLDQSGGYGEASRRLQPRCYSGSTTGGLPGYTRRPVGAFVGSSAQTRGGKVGAGLFELRATGNHRFDALVHQRHVHVDPPVADQVAGLLIEDHPCQP